MKMRIDCLTLPVDDLPRAIAFYRDGLGWPIEEAADTSDHVALTLQNGSYLVFIERAEFSSFVTLAHLKTAPRGASECILSYFAADKQEVDEVLRRAEAAGVRVTAASDRPWGYAGFFADPDSHLWEVLWNPNLSPPQPQ